MSYLNLLKRWEAVEPNRVSIDLPSQIIWIHCPTAFPIWLAEAKEDFKPEPMALGLIAHYILSEASERGIDLKLQISSRAETAIASAGMTGTTSSASDYTLALLDLWVNHLQQRKEGAA